MQLTKSMALVGLLAAFGGSNASADNVVRSLLTARLDNSHQSQFFNVGNDCGIRQVWFEVLGNDAVVTRVQVNTISTRQEMRMDAWGRFVPTLVSVSGNVNVPLYGDNYYFPTEDSDKSVLIPIGTCVTSIEVDAYNVGPRGGAYINVEAFDSTGNVASIVYSPRIVVINPHPHRVVRPNRGGHRHNHRGCVNTGRRGRCN